MWTEIWDIMKVFGVIVIILWIFIFLNSIPGYYDTEKRERKDDENDNNYY
jgi:hypothetical protein